MTLASASAEQHPRILVESLLFPNSLVFNPSGTLFVIASSKGSDANKATQNNNLIFAISAEGQARKLAESGIQGYPATDDHTSVAVYNEFSNLDMSSDGHLLGMTNGGYPVTIDENGVVSFIPFVIPPSGPAIKSADDFGPPHLKDYLNWQLMSIAALPEGRIAFGFNNPSVWYRLRPGEMLEKIVKPEDLPFGLKLSDKNDGVALGTDGYLYGIESAKTPQGFDHLVRVGDPGLSSLRPNATQVRIADFPVKDVNGIVAGPKGQIAFSAASGVYLVEPQK